MQRCDQRVLLQHPDPDQSAADPDHSTRSASHRQLRARPAQAVDWWWGPCQDIKDAYVPRRI